MPRIYFPGGWADLAGPEILNAGHQDEYWDLRDELFAKKEAELPAPEPDPENPAVMAAPAERAQISLNRREVRPLYDLVCGWAVKDCSVAGVLPWTPESRYRIPLVGWNKIRTVIDDRHMEALLGNAPKGDEETEPTSATTSGDTAPAPQQG